MKLNLFVKVRYFVLLITMFITFVPARVFSQKVTVDFSSDQWDKSRAKVVEHLERQALMGAAFLNDVNLKNGIIEVDVATTDRARSYPGVLFRVKDQLNYERIYIRPHRSPFYDDALQYAPTFNGVDSWQLYNGLGKTSSLDILPDKWNHLKIVVSGNQACVFWNEETNPSLIIEPLAYGESSGTMALSGPIDGTAYYSNFSYEIIDTLSLPAVVQREAMCGIITEWELSEQISLKEVDFTKYPDSDYFSRIEWQSIKPNREGLVDVSHIYSRKSRLGDCVFARTTIIAERDTLLRVGFGYSDYITIFLNKQPLFFGNSAYQSRDKSFLGIVGYSDNVFLPLKEGANELLVLVGESMGGWGFCFRKEDETFLHPSLVKTWSQKDSLSLPEAVVYDPANSVCYVANYFNDGNEYLSKISLTGEVLDKEWIKGLRMPTGMCIQNNLLYAVERTALNVIDITKKEVIEKLPLTGMRGPNDVAIAVDGTIFISDMPANAVYKYSNSVLEMWLDNLDGPNGLLVDNDKLLIGQNAKLISADINDKTIETVVELESGSNVDGIQADGNGNYLISDYNGKLYRVSQKGEKTLLLNTSTPGNYIADFAYIKDKKLFIIPTFIANTIDAYSLTK